jgi:hypothetical protein
MTVTIVEEARPVTCRTVTGGVDTHADTHVAAALDPVGGLLGIREFPATAAGYAGLLGWLGGFGTVCLAGTSSSPSTVHDRVPEAGTTTGCTSIVSSLNNVMDKAGDNHGSTAIRARQSDRDGR